MRHLPNILTSINLLCGCWAIVVLQSINYDSSASIKIVYVLFGVSLVMDLLDGMVARLVNAYSELGKQLDSLADMVSFGVFPGFLWFKLFQYSEASSGLTFTFLPYLGFLFTLAVALRLAKFNIDERQSTDFLGVPSPAAAIFTLGLFYWVTNYPEVLYKVDPTMLMELGRGYLNPLLGMPWLILLILLFISAMMLVEIPMFSLKVKKWQWKGNELKVIFLVLSVILLGIWQLMALPLIIVLFILISIIRNFLVPKKD